MSKFNNSLFMVQAQELLTEKIAVGYYVACVNRGFVYENGNKVEINPYTLCRNSGIKDKNGNYVFENDLVKIEERMGVSGGYGYLIWDDFYNTWHIKRSLEYGGYIEPSRCTFVVCGNIILNGSDIQKIVEQDNAEAKREVAIDNSYCPSKFKK